MGELIRLSYKKPESRPAEIQLPASKSISNRLLIMQTLSGGAISISNLSTADDTKILQKALTVESGELNLGLAGTALRFGIAWAAITPGERILKGEDRLHERPVKELVDALIQLGADIEYLENEGYAPLKIVGKKINGGMLKVDGSRSSQFLTALMLIAPYCKAPLLFEIEGRQVSLPYIEMTLNLMKQAGAIITQNDHLIEVSGKYENKEFIVESDWSAASYFYLWSLARPDSKLTMNSLQFDSLQGDKIAADYFSHFGMISHYANGNMTIAKKLVADIPKEIDFLNCPDLAQTFAVAAVIAKKPIKLTGLQTLRHKETDRIAALKTELEKCGVKCFAGADFLELTDFVEVDEVPVINTYNDHRMAMAFAPLAAVFGELMVENPEVVSKSFPDYWNEVAKLGIAVSRQN